MRVFDFFGISTSTEVWDLSKTKAGMPPRLGMAQTWGSTIHFWLCNVEWICAIHSKRFMKETGGLRIQSFFFLSIINFYISVFFMGYTVVKSSINLYSSPILIIKHELWIINLFQGKIRGIPRIPHFPWWCLQFATGGAMSVKHLIV